MEIDGARYLPRVIDRTVEAHLRAFGAVEIAGAMWSGKTWTARAHGASAVSLDNPQARELAEIDVGAVLAGAAPHMIDEYFPLVLMGKTDYKYRTSEGVFVAPITELTL